MSGSAGAGAGFAGAGAGFAGAGVSAGVGVMGRAGLFDDRFSSRPPTFREDSIMEDRCLMNLLPLTIPSPKKVE